MWLLLFLLLSEFSQQSGSASDRESVNRARLHLELTREPLAYLEVRPGEIRIYMQGFEVKRFPVTAAQGFPQRGLKSATIAKIRSAVPPRQVIMDAEEVAVDPSASVASLEEIVSVEDMPDTYWISLSDGSLIFVTTSDWNGVWEVLWEAWLATRAAYAFLWSVIWNSAVFPLHLTLEPSASRELFWHLERRMKVIY